MQNYKLNGEKIKTEVNKYTSFSLKNNQTHTQKNLEKQNTSLQIFSSFRGE